MIWLPQKCLPGIPAYTLTLHHASGGGLLSFPLVFLCLLGCQHSGLCLLVVLPLLGTHMLKAAGWNCRMKNEAGSCFSCGYSASLPVTLGANLL